MSGIMIVIALILLCHIFGRNEWQTLFSASLYRYPNQLNRVMSVTFYVY